MKTQVLKMNEPSLGLHYYHSKNVLKNNINNINLKSNKKRKLDDVKQDNNDSCANPPKKLKRTIITDDDDDKIDISNIHINSANADSNTHKISDSIAIKSTPPARRRCRRRRRRRPVTVTSCHVIKKTNNNNNNDKDSSSDDDSDIENKKDKDSDNESSDSSDNDSDTSSDDSSDSSSTDDDSDDDDDDESTQSSKMFTGYERIPKYFISNKVKKEARLGNLKLRDDEYFPILRALPRKQMVRYLNRFKVFFSPRADDNRLLEKVTKHFVKHHRILNKSVDDMEDELKYAIDTSKIYWKYNAYLGELDTLQYRKKWFENENKTKGV